MMKNFNLLVKDIIRRMGKTAKIKLSKLHRFDLSITKIILRLADVFDHKSSHRLVFVTHLEKFLLPTRLRVYFSQFV